MKNKINLILLISILLVDIILISFLFIKILNKKDIEEDKKWLLTMYGNDEASQMMSFTIEDEKNGLIIIDGGFYSSEFDLKNLESVIERHNNKVDAWIITHFDSDHSGAFLNILENHPEYVIDKIYSPNVFDLDLEYLRQDASWEKETFDLFERFLKLNLDNIHKVHIGEMITDSNLLGLKMKVLSSYEPWMIADGYKNIFNSGGMAFKLYGNKENILFMADLVHENNSRYLMENYSEELLHSDYLQAPHHGNAESINKKIYDLINPKKIFICAPKWLREGDRFDTKNLFDYCNSKNIETISYDKTPYNIIIH